MSLSVCGRGLSKPSRGEISLLLRLLIEELRYLEFGHRFHFSNGGRHLGQVYLFDAYCDKPTQVLLQCISEPTAAFGCGHCEVEGCIFRF